MAARCVLHAILLVTSNALTQLGRETLTSFNIRYPFINGNLLKNRFNRTGASCGRLIADKRVFIDLDRV
jgi:hypothetical protein